jgi:hypothetical protein
MVTPPIDIDGIALAGQNNVVRGNNITGPTGPTREDSGIHLLGKYGIKTTTMSGNTIKDVANALFLEQRFTPSISSPYHKEASTFGAQISRNTFTGYTYAVHAIWDFITSPGPPYTKFYNLLSELSVGQCSLDTATACITDGDCSSRGMGICANSQGNYWELPHQFHQVHQDSTRLKLTRPAHRWHR